MWQKKRYALVFGMCLVLGAAFAQAPDPKAEMKRGLSLFADADYAAARTAFNALARDANAKEIRPEAAYWHAMSLLSLNDFAAAQKSIDVFFIDFPGHSRTGDMLYQKGRVVFLQKRYGEAVMAFQAYMKTFPQGEHVPAALFWTADSLYQLGRIAEAESLYRTVVERHPDSSKFEAAQYRLSLIKFKYREEELLAMLKWSNEETLRVVEEFRRREKAYEQALLVYQKRYGEAQTDAAVPLPSAANDREALLILKAYALDVLETLLLKQTRSGGGK